MAKQPKAGDQVRGVPPTYGIGGLPYFGYRLAVTAKLFDRKFVELLQLHSSLTLPQWRCMAQLGLAEPGTVRSLADGAAVDRAEVRRALAKLEKHGLVERHGNAHDQRSPNFTLTAAGWTVFETVRKPVSQFIRGLIEQVEVADIEAADRVLWTLSQGCLD